MATGSSPLTIGKVSTPICVPRIASCSIAAGRLTSSDAISTRFAVSSRQTFGESSRWWLFYRALQTDHQDRRGRVVDLQTHRACLHRQTCSSSSCDDLYDLLAGRDGFGDRLTGGLFLHRFDKIARDGKGNVSLKQGDPHFAQGGFDVTLGQRALFGQLIKDA